MKKVLLLSIFVFFVLGLNVQAFENNNKDFKQFCSEEDNSQKSNKIDQVLQKKYSEKAKTHAEEYKAAYDAFLKRYYGKIAEAKRDIQYQTKLNSLRCQKDSFVVVGEDRTKETGNFVKVLKEFSDLNSKRSVLNFRVSKLAPKPCQDIIASEGELIFLMSSYRYNVNLCIEGKSDKYTCSAILSPRAEKLLNIAKLAVEVEDMPVVFGAALELYEILKAVNPDSVKGDYEFKLAEYLMI